MTCRKVILLLISFQNNVCKVKQTRECSSQRNACMGLYWSYSNNRNNQPFFVSSNLLNFVCCSLQFWKVIFIIQILADMFLVLPSSHWRLGNCHFLPLPLPLPFHAIFTHPYFSACLNLQGDFKNRKQSSHSPYKISFFNDLGSVTERDF